MSKSLRIGIAGLGTVGGGLVSLLAESSTRIAQRCGRSVDVTAVSARRRDTARGFDVSSYAWFDDAAALAQSPDIDVFVELIGGTDVAAAAVRAALSAGKHVVTANKALIAAQGSALAALAEAKGVTLSFEAAVAGGIPVIKAIREGLAANRLTRVAGILNGTCNYILTEMERTGRSFAEVLKEAQALGYAEADPTLDVGGGDTAHKLTVLASLAFGIKPEATQVRTEGITAISPVDITFGKEFGYRIKLLGVAAQTEAGFDAFVAPAMAPHGTPLADTMGVLNAVVTQSSAAGMTFLQGRGAGAGPTASAVAADLIDLARGLHVPVFGVPSGQLSEPHYAPSVSRQGAYYLRFDVIDRPGVLATIARCLADHHVSVESMIQRGRAPGEQVAIVILTHEAKEDDTRLALKAIERAGAVTGAPCMIRMERV